MLLLVLRHIDADHGALIVEQELGQRAGQLGFADAGGPKEHETADGPVGILQSGARPHHGFRHRLHGFVLAHHPLVQLLLQMQQLLHFAFEQLGNRNAGPAADHLGDVLLVHFFLEQAVAVLLFGQAAFLGFELASPDPVSLPYFNSAALFRSYWRSAFSISTLVCSICSRSARSVGRLPSRPAIAPSGRRTRP